MSKNILILTLNYLGGSKIFLDQYIERTLKDCNIWILKSENSTPNPINITSRLFLFNYHDLSGIGYVFNADIKNLNEILQKLNIDEIFVNHLIHFDFSLMLNWLLNCKVPFKIFLHDYYCICPNVHLQHCNVNFCELSRVHGLCQYHLKGVDILQWRKYWHILLSNAKKIICPSSYMANIVKQIYLNLNFEVQPHILTSELSRTFKPEFASREKLRITFLGQMYEYKGEEYFLKLNEMIQRENLPVEFILLGYFKEEVLAGTKKGIIFAGAYDVNEVSKKLAELETAIVAVMSNVAETYCYTASEAILSGYPVMALNIGAHSVRIAKHNCGWIFPIETPDRGLGNLKHFIRLVSTPEFRKDILLKAANTINFKNGME